MANNNQNGKMSREEAGRLGGEATAKNHDKEFYQEIGEKGGDTTSKNHGKDFYQEIGEKGGEATSKNHDKEFYQEIGRKGGEARGNSDQSDSDGKMSREEAGAKAARLAHANVKIIDNKAMPSVQSYEEAQTAYKHKVS